MAKHGEHTQGLRRHAPTIILAVVFLLGACLLAYPTVSDWWNQHHATRAVASYERAVEDLSAEDLEVALSAARAYNAELAEAPASFELADAELERYEGLLAVAGADAMATLEIPRINVKLPIYHGTSDGVLQAGVGHLMGSSLPVGGSSTHCVLMGHRGLPSARLLTDLDQLEVGDSFCVTALGDRLWYEVDQILIVEPDDVSSLSIVPGEDLCTLVTCTPYGVNTHRLLVRGHRVSSPYEGAHLTSDAVRVDPLLVASVVAVPVLLVLVVAVLVSTRRKGRRA